MLPLDQFLEKHWWGKRPDRSYFGGRQVPKFFFAPEYRDGYRKALDIHFPGSSAEIIRQADKAVAHVFDLLGSGDTYLGPQIDWHCDFKSGRVWDRDIYTRVRLVYSDDESDVKVPWELSRMQFLTDLGRAHFVSDNHVYKAAFMSLLNNWEISNPVDIGVNWTCSMEVAIRAINIIWGMHFFHFDDAETEFVQRIIRLLYHHAYHIEQNIEIISGGANTNHLVSDYLGLYYLGLLLPELDRAGQWKDIGRAGLENEIRCQVMPDGPDYEGSTSYHRLVLEMFLSAYILGKINGCEFCGEYGDRLSKMVDFSEAVTGNSGLTPLIGDNDNGYFVKLASDNPADHRPLIDTCRKILNQGIPSWLLPTEERLWYLGPESLAESRPADDKGRLVLFERSGYAIIRNDRLHLIFNASSIPDGNLGGHKHNDLLSFTLEIDGIPYLIDPGVFCYTADFALRNLSRSTAYHNTVTVDGEEQNRFPLNRLFYVPRESRTKFELWNETKNQIVVSASHTGYLRLNDKITHRRTISVDRSDPAVVITDEFEGTRDHMHRYSSRFFTPDSKIDQHPDKGISIFRGNSSILTIKNSAQGLDSINIIPIEYFPGYGKKARGYQIEFNHNGKLPFTAVTAIALSQQAKITLKKPALPSATLVEAEQ